jgi:hypothetical protein
MKNCAPLFLGILLGCAQVRAQSNTLSRPDLADLANRFAPQLMHPSNEPNLPTNVEWLLSRTTLSFESRACIQDNRSFGRATAALLASASITSACDGHLYTASGTRNGDKSKTFLLNDVDRVDQHGSIQAADWTTYYHAYPNDSGGWTIQYWTFYAFNTGQTIKVPLLPSVQIGYHGGDWEMVAVVLGPHDVPLNITTTGHSSIVRVPWNLVTKHGTHPVVYTERGGHEVHADQQNAGPYIEHPTWAGTLVHGLPGGDAAPGPLVSLGSRLHPTATWLSYSGLWGSLGATPISSGYWGPAFNETGMSSDGFLTAWCIGTAHPQQQEGTKKECYPDDMR